MALVLVVVIGVHPLGSKSRKFAFELSGAPALARQVPREPMQGGA
jgi:hypothetical protein